MVTTILDSSTAVHTPYIGYPVFFGRTTKFS
eukprot:SAG31_NODE_9983_length_1201_cov_1.162432_2_plen_30_part_01